LNCRWQAVRLEIPCSAGWHPLVLRSEALLRRVVQTCLGVVKNRLSLRARRSRARQSQPSISKIRRLFDGVSRQSRFVNGKCPHKFIAASFSRRRHGDATLNNHLSLINYQLKSHPERTHPPHCHPESKRGVRVFNVDFQAPLSSKRSEQAGPPSPHDLKAS